MATKEDETGPYPATRADAILRRLHRDLFPEKYPGWDAEEDGECLEWDSGTIEWVADAIVRYIDANPEPPANEDQVGARSFRIYDELDRVEVY